MPQTPLEGCSFTDPNPSALRPSHATPRYAQGVFGPSIVQPNIFHKWRYWSRYWYSAEQAICACSNILHGIWRFQKQFSQAQPWNSLPYNINLTTDTNRFKNFNRLKRLLKSHLFHLAFWHSVSAPEQFCKPRFMKLYLCLYLYYTEANDLR